MAAIRPRRGESESDMNRVRRLVEVALNHVDRSVIKELERLRDKNQLNITRDESFNDEAHWFLLDELVHSAHAFQYCASRFMRETKGVGDETDTTERRHR